MCSLRSLIGNAEIILLRYLLTKLCYKSRVRFKSVSKLYATFLWEAYLSMTGNSMDWWKGGNSKPTSLSNHRGTFLMGRYARKKQHKGDKPLKEKYRTKRKTKDLDQIDEDLRPENSSKLQHQEVDLDKPGSGQFYCLHCAKYFIDTNALRTHFKSKPHKRRLKALETEPYTQAEAERAAGMGSYKEPSKRKMETQSLVSDMKVDISGDGVV